ncbi:MAG: HAMP domain-containing sensor histidine kinase [Opitutus sp.]
MRSIDVNYWDSGENKGIVWSLAKETAGGQKDLLQPDALSSSKSVPTFASELPALLRLGGSAPFNDLILEAGRLAFPGIGTTVISDLADARNNRLTPRSGALLVLFEPDAAVLAEARAATDIAGLPAWGVVPFISTPPSETSDPDAIHSVDWNPPTVARALRWARERHRLQRENARLRGDLLTFGTRITHDLRTPLGGVLTTTEMLREVLAEDAPNDVALTQPILDSTEGLVKLIERASFFARTSASREPRRTLDMSGPFWNAFQHLEGTMMKAQSSFTYPSAWPSVEGHESWLEGVWRALLTNAIQHGVPGSKIEAGWSTESNEHRFWVRNEGTVQVEKEPRLFFPFHRLHESGAPRGLGLPTVQRLVEMEGGHCGFTIPNPGTVEFFFCLPSASEKVTSLTPGAA